MSDRVVAITEREKISFNQLNKETGNRVRYRKVDAETGNEVPQENIIKGYEVAKASASNGPKEPSRTNVFNLMDALRTVSGVNTGAQSLT